MKRLVWLFLAAFCLAVAQVQPVEAVTQAKPKPCCGCEGKCGMPACPMPVASGPTAFDAARPVTVARPASARESRVVRRAREKFFASFVSVVAVPRAVPATLATASASVPLYRAHCSFLI